MSDATTSIPADEAKPLPKKRSWRWRFFRFVVLSFFGLVTLFVLFHAVENWRGKRAWEQYRKKQEAKGVSFDFNSIVPPPVLEEKNFAMTPLLKRGLELNPFGVHTEINGVSSHFKDPAANLHLGVVAYEAPLYPSGYKEKEGEMENEPAWRLGGRINLERWQKAFMTSTNFPHRSEPGVPAADVLYALDRFQKEFAELEQASRERSEGRFDVRYDNEEKAGILLPHLSVVKGLCKRLGLRSTARLKTGQAEAAFADVNLIFHLADSIKSEPILISKLVRIASMEISIKAIWEGMQDHSWNDGQLKEFQNRLSSYDFVKDGWHGLQGEHLFGNSMVEYLRRYPHRMGAIGYNNSEMNLPFADGSERHLFKLIPNGWFYFEQVNFNDAYDRFILSPASKSKDQMDLKKAKVASESMKRELSDHNPLKAISNHRVLTHLLLPWVKNFTMKSAYAQSTADLAIVAIGLERYYLKHQDYPASLAALVPEYVPVLPLDIAVKAPFKYERQSKDAFRLWSVGWNEKDDKGTVVTHGGKNINLDEGDWTWPQVEKTTATQSTIPAGAFE